MHEEVLRFVREKRSFWQKHSRGGLPQTLILVGHILRHPTLDNLIMEGSVDTLYTSLTSFTQRYKGRQKLKYIKYIIEDLRCGKYVDIKRLVQERKEWIIASNQSHSYVKNV